MIVIITMKTITMIMIIIMELIVKIYNDLIKITKTAIKMKCLTRMTYNKKKKEEIKH